MVKLKVYVSLPQHSAVFGFFFILFFFVRFWHRDKKKKTKFIDVTKMVI